MTTQALDITSTFQIAGKRKLWRKTWTFPLGTLLEVTFNTSAYIRLAKHMTTPSRKDTGDGSFHSG